MSQMVPFLQKYVMIPIMDVIGVQSSMQKTFMSLYRVLNLQGRQHRGEVLWDNLVNWEWGFMLGDSLDLLRLVDSKKKFRWRLLMVSIFTA